MNRKRAQRLSVCLMIMAAITVLTLSPVSAATDSFTESAGWLADVIIACVNFFIRLVMIFVG